MKYEEKIQMADRLYQLRKDGKTNTGKKLTQAKLAQLIRQKLGTRTSRNTVVNYETGATQPNIEILQFYKDYFHTTYNYILEGEETDSSEMCQKFQSLSPKEKRIILNLMDGLKELR